MKTAKYLQSKIKIIKKLNNLKKSHFKSFRENNFGCLKFPVLLFYWFCSLFQEHSQDMQHKHTNEYFTYVGKMLS